MIFWIANYLAFWSSLFRIPFVCLFLHICIEVNHVSKEAGDYGF